MTTPKPREALEFPDSDRAFLEPHLPPPTPSHDRDNNSKPFVTLTYATSLDASLALSPGQQTALSGPQSKAMTHYLRSRHDAILIGAGTAIADDPSLNCRLAGVSGYGGGDGAGAPLAGQPQPVVVDPRGRWAFTAEAKLFGLCREGRGRPPWVVTAAERAPPPERVALLAAYGGKYISMPCHHDDARLDWRALLATLREHGLRSVMVEGGGHIINSLLAPPHLDAVDAVIVTIAPTWLGRGGVVVSPARRVDEGGNAVPAARLAGVRWRSFGEDVVMCGSIKR